MHSKDYAFEGLYYYLAPDFSTFSPNTILVAMGQVFYSLSLGFGIMLTFGSYLSKKNQPGKCRMLNRIFHLPHLIHCRFCYYPGKFPLYKWKSCSAWFRVNLLITPDGISDNPARMDNRGNIFHPFILRSPYLQHRSA
ncbi:MAG: hypothetical protein KBS37_04800 [Methanocorpusculum sp.]|nr:hypothetical protein [Candidatus Methanocorpusculum equi]